MPVASSGSDRIAGMKWVAPAGSVIPACQSAKKEDRSGRGIAHRRQPPLARMLPLPLAYRLACSQTQLMQPDDQCFMIRRIASADSSDFGMNPATDASSISSVKSVSV